MFKPGFILKIEVRDFVTCNFLEMYPGPQLNMIIGPNGSGKSTIVAAIILGLGGNPKTVGRGNKISEYIKHNCKEAKIKIVLQGNADDDKIVIIREISLQDKSTWFLNNEQVGQKEIQQVINSFNIQVDNLCQFLPQDRVHEFAKLNKQQLLKQTMQAICRNDLIDKQQQLITNCKQLKETREPIEGNQTKLQEYRDANRILEGRIENLNKKKSLKTQIEHIKRKISWLTYEDLRANRDQIEKDQAKATEVYNKHKESLARMNNAINKVTINLRDYSNRLNYAVNY